MTAPRDLGGLQLDEVAVQIESLAIGVLTHHRRPILPGPVLVLRAQPLIPVGIEDRHHQKDQAVEQRPQRASSQIAQQHLRRFLPLHFSGVDVGLQIDDRLPGAMGFGGTGRQRSRGQHVGNRSSFWAGGQGPCPDVAGDPGQGIQKLEHVGVGRGLPKTGALGAGGLSRQGHGHQRGGEGHPAPAHRADVGLRHHDTAADDVGKSILDREGHLGDENSASRDSRPLGRACRA